ncbi:MAG: VWA domain-containing protein [Gemmatimonadota bacterium]|jgi:Ca-activated chloride channel family protein|nr:VWA domain-containing protein [Gemmatimonadota bacterium]
MEIEFARPEAFRLLLVLPVWALLVWPWPGGGLAFVRGDTARSVVGRWSVSAALILTLPRLLRAATLVCLVVALARPERVEVVETRSFRGKGIGLAVDLSSSMLATDMGDGRSRIDVAREAATRFAATREFDELSLVGFARGALTRVPPTEDRNIVVAGVQSLEVQLVGDGTDIAGAVLTAANRLIQSEREPRVVILLTDGAHNGTNVQPLVAARAAAAMGVRVHAISILPPEDPDNAAMRRVLFSGDDPREEMRTVLGGIAEITGGRYFHASSAATLDSIYQEINRIEAPIELVETARTTHPLRVWAILASLVFLTADLVLRGTRWAVIP